MLQLFSFIENQFSKMPRSVQVLTYLTILFLIIYLTLKPKFITGYIQYERPNGTFGDYRGGDLRLRVGPNTLKITSDEKGFWSFPIFDSVPTSVEIHIRGMGEEFWQKLTIPAQHIWLQQSNIIIVFDENKTRNRFFLAEKKPSLSLIQTAHAGMLKNIFKPQGNPASTTISAPSSANGENMSPSTPSLSHTITPQPYITYINVPPSTQKEQKAIPLNDLIQLEKTETKRIIYDICGIVSEVTATERKKVNGTYSFLGKNAPSYIEKLEIITEVESIFNTRIPDEHWQSLVDIKEMADYIFERQILEKSTPLSQATQEKLDNYDWPAFQDEYQIEQKPSFAPYESK